MIQNICPNSTLLWLSLRSAQTYLFTGDIKLNTPAPGGYFWPHLMNYIRSQIRATWNQDDISRADEKIYLKINRNLTNNIILFRLYKIKTTRGKVQKQVLSELSQKTFDNRTKTPWKPEIGFEWQPWPQGFLLSMDPTCNVSNTAYSLNKRENLVPLSATFDVACCSTIRPSQTGENSCSSSTSSSDAASSSPSCGGSSCVKRFSAPAMPLSPSTLAPLVLIQDSQQPLPLMLLDISRQMTASCSAYQQHPWR